VFGPNVAATMGNGVVHASLVDPFVVLGALIGAIVWNLLTSRLGLPSSSSHALVGGLIGAGIAKAGLSAVVWHGGEAGRDGGYASGTGSSGARPYPPQDRAGGRYFLISDDPAAGRHRARASERSQRVVCFLATYTVIAPAA
jgi:hypothetical protein